MGKNAKVHKRLVSSFCSAADTDTDALGHRIEEEDCFSYW